MNISILIEKVSYELVYYKQMCAGTGKLVLIVMVLFKTPITHKPTTILMINVINLI